jgi:two-component system, OmpR family, response regulator PrrA
MTEPLVVVADDDRAIRTGLDRELTREGFTVVTVGGGVAALLACDRLRPAAIVLDVSMPDLDGFSVCSRLRVDGHDLAVLMLSARSETPFRVEGLGRGADDYLVKPFEVEELVARLHALLRRSRAGPVPGPRAAPRLVVGDLVVDQNTREVWRADEPVDLTPREFDLLLVLVRSAGVVVRRERLLQLVWGYEWPADTNVVDVFVSYLRRKLEACGRPRLLHTVRGVGFRVGA